MNVNVSKNMAAGTLLFFESEDYVLAIDGHVSFSGNNSTADRFGDLSESIMEWRLKPGKKTRKGPRLTNYEDRKMASRKARNRSKRLDLVRALKTLTTEMFLKVLVNVAKKYGHHDIGLLQV